MDLRAASPTYDRVLSNFEAAIMDFVNTGFFEKVDPKFDRQKSWFQHHRERDQRFPISQTFVRKVVRQVAKEMRRPIIIAQTDWWSGDVRTIIALRHTKRNAPLIAQFLLLEETRNYNDRNKSPVTRRQDTVNWYVQFNGKRGQQLYRDWKANCLADPECRKALKLPPLEEPVKLAA